MDRHVTRWHQMISRDSFGSEILISCHPPGKKVKSIGSARTGLAYWCKWKLEYQIERSELERFLQGDFEFCSQVHRACLPHWLRKKAVSTRREPLRWMSPRSATIMSGALRATVWTSLSCPGGFHILGRRCSTVSFYGRMLGVIGIRVLDMRGWEEISRD